MSVVIILGTNRDNSNTLSELKKKYASISYELIELHKLEIDHYEYDGYDRDDDFMKVADKMICADHIIFATPVYWYAMSGRMKVFLDRFTDLISTSKEKGRALAGKTTELFGTGSGDKLPEGFEVPFQSTSEYFDMKFLRSTYVSLRKGG